MKRTLTLTALLLLCGLASAEDREEKVAAFVQEMADKHGFDALELSRAFEAAPFRPRIVELMNRQYKPKPWTDYRALFVNPQKIDAALRFWQSNREVLARASERYGVPEEIILAVLGIETHYGTNTGGFKVLEALKTLAFDYPRRADMFRTELEHFLLLAREEAMSPDRPKGSYAGAMGIAQFMPGSYRRYAVDFDGDGRKDLFGTNADAIGSVANYLTAHGWQRDEPVAVPAQAGSSVEPFRDASLSTRYSLGRLKELGVTTAGAYPGTKSAIPLTLNNATDAEYWLGFDNFYVITRYNRSVFYAMAVYQLSEALRDRRAPKPRAGRDAN